MTTSTCGRAYAEKCPYWSDGQHHHALVSCEAGVPTVARCPCGDEISGPASRSPAAPVTNKDGACGMPCEMRDDCEGPCVLVENHWKSAGSANAPDFDCACAKHVGKPAPAPVDRGGGPGEGALAVGDWLEATEKGYSQGFVSGPYQLTERIESGWRCMSSGAVPFRGVILDENLTHDCLVRRGPPSAEPDPTPPVVERALPSMLASTENPTAKVCRGCEKPLKPENARMIDGCPCNSPRGINHGLVPKNTCTCMECDPAQTGPTRYPVEAT